MELRIKKLHPNAIIPTRAHPTDSGLDLCACLPDGPVWIAPGEHRVISSGVAVEFPPAPLSWPSRLTWEAQVRPRSGLAAKHGIQTSFGTIDNSYRGDIGVNLFNFSFVQFKVSHGDRIAQLVVAPVAIPGVVVVDELSDTERGEAGFGSTGV